MTSYPRAIWTPASGPALDLNSPGFMLEGLDNAGIMPVRHIATKIPGRPGEVVTRMIMDERYLGVRVVVYGSDIVDLYASRNTLIDAFNPIHGEGTLLYQVGPEEPERVIRGRYQNGADFPASKPNYEGISLSLRCSDPTWREIALTNEEIVCALGGLSYPVSIPQSFGTNFEEVTITNDGNAETYPIITVDGPFDTMRIENRTTGQHLTFEGSLGSETLTIDTEAQAVVGSASGDLVYRLSETSTFWQLLVGDNDIRVAVENGPASVTIDIDYYHRFIGL